MNEKQKTLVSVVVVVLVLAGSLAWGWVEWKRLSKVQVAVQDKGKELKGLREKIGAIQALRQERDTLRTELAEYEDILPNDKELNDMLDTLSDFGKQSGVVIKEFKPEREARETPDNSGSSYKPVTYRLLLVGDFFKVTKFINLLENYKRFVRVDSFDITRKEQEKANEAVLVISTFMYDPKSKPVRPVRKAANARAGAAQPQTQTLPFDLKIERAGQYVFADAAGLRNPFSSPLTPRDGQIDRELAVEDAVPLAVDQEKELVVSLQENIGNLSALLDKGQFNEASKLYIDIERQLAREFQDPVVSDQVAQVRAESQRLGTVLREGRGERVFQMVTALYERMNQAFETRDYEGALKQRTAVDELLRSAGTVHYTGLTALVEEIGRLADRIKTYKDFAAVSIRVQGVFWTGDGRAAAIINDQSLVEGDSLKMVAVIDPRKGAGSDKQVFVHKIQREKITFRYQGELIDKVLVE